MNYRFSYNITYMNTNKFIQRFHKFLRILFRNKKKLDGNRIVKNRVNLEWVNNNNLGDSLGPIIYEWMLRQKGLNINSPTKKTVHLFTCGSLIGVGYFDVTVWGSGIHLVTNIANLIKLKPLRKYDIRAVRGPVTRQILIGCGYQCPAIYGDPAIIMPLIYDETVSEKKYDISIILHYHVNNEDFTQSECNYIHIGTTDYKKVIQEMKLSRKIISSSLHGIILAETYGVPAVFLNTGDYVDKALMKYYDWYYSTGRMCVKIATTIEEAIAMEPMPLPDLTELREKLMNSFPYDLWNK